MMRRSCRATAFTLIELLVVIAIIALLVSILMPSLTQARELARIAACASNQRNVYNTLQIFGSENGEYPQPVDQLDWDKRLTKTTVYEYWDGNPPPVPYTSWAFNYTYGAAVWWVGVATNDPNWFLRKEFQCTGRMAEDSSRPATWPRAWQERGDWGNLQYFLGSTLNGKMTMDPDPQRAVNSAWYVYLHPNCTSTSGYDWWDAGMAGNDFAKLTYNTVWKSDYKIGNDGLADVQHGPWLSEPGRRAMLTCPVSSILDPSWGRYLYEPHGARKYTGCQMFRSTDDPEDKNYLYTDGSVIRVTH